jgi:hypothetical protein
VGLKAGDHHFDALLEVGGSVVAGEFGGHGAYPGEFAAGEAVQAEPEQVVGLVGVVDKVLQLVEDVPVQESEEQPVGAMIPCPATREALGGE